MVHHHVEDKVNDWKVTVSISSFPSVLSAGPSQLSYFQDSGWLFSQVPRHQPFERLKKGIATSFQIHQNGSKWDWVWFEVLAKLIQKRRECLGPFWWPCSWRYLVLLLTYFDWASERRAKLRMTSELMRRRLGTQDWTPLTPWFPSLQIPAVKSLLQSNW